MLAVSMAEAVLEIMAAAVEASSVVVSSDSAAQLATRLSPAARPATPPDTSTRELSIAGVRALATSTLTTTSSRWTLFASSSPPAPAAPSSFGRRSVWQTVEAIGPRRAHGDFVCM